MAAVRIIGAGRAGRSLHQALREVGWPVRPLLTRGDDLAAAARDTDLVVIATPDAAIAEVARSIEPRPGVAVVHLAGSRGLEVLDPHERRGAMHPLLSLPNADVGARRLRAGGWFAVAGDPIVGEVVAALGGRTFEVVDADRAAYHATACVASNHLVALLGQVERLAAAVGVPIDAFLDLATGSLANVEALGAHAALTGPAARGDDETIERHRAAIPADELALYDELVAAARRLARQDDANPEVR